MSGTTGGRFTDGWVVIGRLSCTNCEWLVSLKNSGNRRVSPLHVRVRRRRRKKLSVDSRFGCDGSASGETLFRSADCQSAVSRIGNPPGLISKGGLKIRTAQRFCASPTGGRRHSRLPVCATAGTRQVLKAGFRGAT